MGGYDLILHRCEKGHYFDSDKFAECPYCSLGKNVVEDVTYDYDNGYESTETVVARRGSIKIHNTGKGVN